MTVTPDPYTFANATTADATQVNARYAPLYAALNGALDVDNILAAVKEKLGLSDASTVRRGRTVVATAQGRTNTAYGTLATPDQVSSVVMPTDGLILVWYRATWQESVDGAARAAIFVGANQLKIAGGSSAAPFVQEARCVGGVGIDKPLSSGPQGLTGQLSSNATVYTGDVSTGQAIGVLDESGTIDGTVAFGFGACAIEADPGTYTISVQFKASSGTVTVKNRKLRVLSIGFA